MLVSSLIQESCHSTKFTVRMHFYIRIFCKNSDTPDLANDDTKSVFCKDSSTQKTPLISSIAQ